MNHEITSLERVLTALSHKEPDRVPLFLMLSLYGAKEMGLSVKNYFANPDNVIKTQQYMKKKYANDCYSSFYYAAIEVEACGGEVIFCDDGPPNSGEPIIKKTSQISSFMPPEINDSGCLLKILNTIRQLKSDTNNDAPIIGVAVSPFSLPVMQLGFDKYIELIYDQPVLFEELIKKNTKFCVDWANAQLSAGATAICYFDPVSSPTIIPRELYLKTGFKIAKNVISQIKGPTATHLASGLALPIADKIAETGTLAISVSQAESIKDAKNICAGKLSLIGNLNGIEMVNWSGSEAETNVKNIIEMAASGGGLIISDCHGEIPYQVKSETLLAISAAVSKWGTYKK